MIDRKKLRDELKKDAQLFGVRVKKGMVKLGTTLSVVTSMVGAPQISSAAEYTNNDGNKEPQEYFDKYKRIVDYQVDTVDNSFGALASFSPSKNIIIENYNVDPNNEIIDSKSSKIAHEINHKDIHMTKLENAPMSLGQKYNTGCHDEISSHIVGIMQVRQEYLNAKNDEERNAIIAKNPLCNFYFQALKEGKITNQHSTVEEFDAEMKFIAQKIQKMFLNSLRAGSYDNQTINGLKLYFSSHDYDYFQPNEENYNTFLEYTYNIGGIDFRKYLDDFNCPNETVIKADEMIKNNVSRAKISDTIITNEENSELKIQKQKEQTKQQTYEDFDFILKKNQESMSLEQAVMLKFDSKRAEDISNIISVKNKYFEAKSDEEKKEIAEGIKNYDAKEYYNLLINGKINTEKEKLSKDDLDYINNMFWIINPNECAQIAQDYYMVYKNEAVRNDENFLKKRSTIYTFDGIDYSKELDFPSVNITGLNILEADAMIKNNASYEEVNDFLRQSKNHNEMFYVKGEANLDLSPKQQIKIEEHRLFLQNLMHYYGYGKTEDFAKHINNYIDMFKSDLKNVDKKSNYFQLCVDIATNVEKNNEDKLIISKDNDDLYKQELTKVYTVNGINLLEHINGNIEDALPKLEELDKIKNKVLDNLDDSLWKRKRNKSEKDVEYYRYKEIEEQDYYGSPKYFEWSEERRVSDVQQIEIYNFKSNILKDQRDAVALREVCVNAKNSTEALDNKVDIYENNLVENKTKKTTKDTTNRTFVITLDMLDI